MTQEETAPYIKEHNGTQICFADTIVQATNALKRTGLAPNEDATKLNGAHLMLFGVENFNNMKDFEKAFKDSKNTFTRLEIFGCEMNDKAQQEMAQAFDPACMKNIKTLDLDNTALTKEGAAAIFAKLAECQSIEKLNLQGSIPNPDVMKAIDKALVENCNLFGTLSDLDLKINDLKSNSAESVANLMTRFEATPANHIIKVDLFYNDIGADGARAIALALQSDKCNVTHLDLCCNNIGDDGATAIGRALVMNKTLESLKLALNNIGNKGAIEIFQAFCPLDRTPNQLINTKLNLLDLSANVMKEEVQKNVDQPNKNPAKFAELSQAIEAIDNRLLEIEMDASKDAEAAELSTRRAELAPQKRALQAQESPLCDQVMEVLQKSPYLHDIDITGIEFDNRGWDKFATGLQKVPNSKIIRFSIVDLMSEENLKTVEEKIWNDGKKDQYKHIDWRRRDDAAPANN